MNINVSLPSIVPNQLHPQTEAAQTDNRRAELVPQLRQSEAASAESGVASQKERSRSAPNNANPQPQSRDNAQTGNPAGLPQRFVEATDEEGKRRQQESGQQKQQKQQRLLDVLVERDLEVRKHEQAHQAAGGEHAGSPTYEYAYGPDGKRYASGGEVAIDIGVIHGDPAATQAKMQQVRTAALAPVEPSSQDLSVARSATVKEAQARKELMAAGSEEQSSPLGLYMDKRNQVIAHHYQQASRPALRHSFGLDI